MIHNCSVETAPRPKILQNKIDKELLNLFHWCYANKLAINPIKSHDMKMCSTALIALAHLLVEIGNYIDSIQI